LRYEVKERSDGDVLVVHVANPSDRLYRLLNEAQAAIPQSGLFPTRATLQAEAPKDRLHRPETELYLKVLSESLSVTRDSFHKDFSDRYISSVFGAEAQILSEANHIVFGRRGSGKSSLLLYALSEREDEGQPNAWVELQVYQSRNDVGVIADVLWEIVRQVGEDAGTSSSLSDVRERLRDLADPDGDPTLEDIRRALPGLRRALSVVSHQGKSLFVFLDDLHVLPTELQPSLLAAVYAVARGNNIHLKISSIESFTRTWDPGSREGLEVTHDVQVLRLDYNLTRPAKARTHIESILDAHAHYCGLDSARYLCNDARVIDRLVWAAAGVPRDALNVFTQAITAGIIDEQPRLTVTNINKAASEAVNDKLRDIQLDVSGSYEESMRLLEAVKEMCVQEKKRNAFLVEISNDDPIYEGILRLIDLRLLHVIHEGITVRQAGRKFIALILDFGFYVGIRAAKSIELFEPPVGTGQYEALRTLPIFRG
jgi:GTPase SAR1 family protein